jgi:hypothetical protein
MEKGGHNILIEDDDNQQIDLILLSTAPYRLPTLSEIKG